MWWPKLDLKNFLCLFVDNFSKPRVPIKAFQDDDAQDVHSGKLIKKKIEDNISLKLFQSMPKMPENEAKEETAESREEKKEQVNNVHYFLKDLLIKIC